MAVNDRKVGLEGTAAANLYTSQRGCDCSIVHHKARSDSIHYYLLGASFGRRNIACLDHAILVYCNLMALAVLSDCEPRGCQVVEEIPILRHHRNNVRHYCYNIPGIHFESVWLDLHPLQHIRETRRARLVSQYDCEKSPPSIRNCDHVPTSVFLQLDIPACHYRASASFPIPPVFLYVAQRLRLTKATGRLYCELGREFQRRILRGRAAGPHRSARNLRSQENHVFLEEESVLIHQVHRE